MFRHSWLRVCCWTCLCACGRYRGIGLCCRTMCRAEPVVVTACVPPFIAAHLLLGPCMRLRRISAMRKWCCAMLMAPCWPHLPYTQAIEVAVSQDVMAVRNARRRSASDTLTSVARCFCCARLVVPCWTGKVAFNLYASDLWARFAGRLGSAQHDTEQCLRHGDKLGAVFVLREAGCLVVDRQGCIQRARR
jgi:hypothetical protein